MVFLPFLYYTHIIASAGPFVKQSLQRIPKEFSTKRANLQGLTKASECAKPSAIGGESFGRMTLVLWEVDNQGASG